MKKIIVLLLAIALLCTGCATSGDTSAPAADPAVAEDGSTAPATGGESKKIFFMVKNLTNPFFVQMADEAAAKCEEYGWECEILSPVKSDNNEEQIQLIEQALLKNPDLFCVVPADSKGIVPGIEAINAAGVPLINTNTKIDDDSVEMVSFVAIENYEAAKLSVTQGAELIGNEGNVIILEGVTGAQTSIDRVAGAKDVVDSIDGLELLTSQTANYSRPESMQVMQDLLQKYDDIDLVFAAAGEMALGAAEAIKQAGRQDEIVMCTINSYQEVLEAVKDGRITVSVDDMAGKQGSESIVAAKRYFDGETVEPEILLMGVIVDQSNVDEYLAYYQ